VVNIQAMGPLPDMRSPVLQEARSKNITTQAVIQK